MLVAVGFAFFGWANGPVRGVFLGTALAVLEEAYAGWGPKVNVKRPRGWLVGACLSPLLPFLALGTANLGLVWGLAFGFVTTVVGWRICVRPALRDEDEPLTPRYALLLVAALALVGVNAVIQPAPLASSLLSACLTLWLAALLAIPVLRVAKRRWRLAWPARAALVAGACALLALALAAHDLARVDGALAGKLQAIAERSPVIPAGTMAAARSDDALAEAFAPRLFLAKDGEAWPENPMLDLRGGTRVAVKGGVAVTDRCFHYDERCHIAPEKPDYPYGAGSPPPYAVMYVHVAHPGDPEFKNARLVPKRLGPPVTTLLQYWLYYGYDRFDALTPVGRLVQEHESDWEAVTVGLAADRPLFVAYNAHCGGQWLPWSRVPAAFSKTQETERYRARGFDALAGVHEPTHPAVMVAGGSQASYPAAGSVRVPDWTSCTLKTSFGDALAFAASIRETVDVAREVIPVAVPPATRAAEPMSFGGFWGLNNHSFCLRLAFDLSVGCGGDDGPGPQSPPLKADWKDPFGVIFHSGTWHEGADPAG